MRVAFPSFPANTPAGGLENRGQATGRPPWATGIAHVDTALGGGFAHGRIHEFYAAEPDDVAAAAGFVATLAIGTTGNARPVVWLRPRQAVRAGGVMQGAGWAELGGAPETCLFVLGEDTKSLLRAGVDALRSGGFGVVVIEGWGAMRELDLTASRRLSLAAERSGTLLLLLRTGAEPAPSAAETRWSVASAPSQALAANAPGAPTFDIELLRRKSGLSGLRWRLEWNRDQCTFRDAAVSGAVVPVPLRRPAADAGAGPLRRAG
ncbi:ImuA family protein [Novosphingobium lentum]|uniref:ImuA family protein n=1 Tax=Novosphingobium lentum TaxID=145287 RepID=UPI00083171A7|nr:hypothetical protein [Novosphingobium lentum]